MDLMEIVVRAASESCEMSRFCTRGAEISGSVTTELFSYYSYMS